MERFEDMMLYMLELLTCQQEQLKNSNGVDPDLIDMSPLYIDATDRTKRKVNSSLTEKFGYESNKLPARISMLDVAVATSMPTNITVNNPNPNPSMSRSRARVAGSYFPSSPSLTNLHADVLKQTVQARQNKIEPTQK
jgi:hypothetical protein